MFLRRHFFLLLTLSLALLVCGAFYGGLVGFYQMLLLVAAFFIAFYSDIILERMIRRYTSKHRAEELIGEVKNTKRDDNPS